MSGLVCEAHPWIEFPHTNCGGPGMRREQAAVWLDDALFLLAQMAKDGDEQARLFLDTRGILWERPDGYVPTSEIPF